MKLGIRWMIVCFALVIFTGSAVAAGVKLINKDNASYRLFVKHQTSGVHTSIGANGHTKICSGQCTIRIKGKKASIVAAEGDTIIIRNGQLKKKK